MANIRSEDGGGGRRKTPPRPSKFVTRRERAEKGLEDQIKGKASRAKRRMPPPGQR